jgi:TatA/E family protein of Tat protein translocase
MNLGPKEIIILLIVVLVLFGAKRLPDSARSLGRSMRIFKSEMKEMKADDSVIEEDGKKEN